MISRFGSGPSSPDSAGIEHRLLVLASTVKDGEVASRVLAAAAIDCVVCAGCAQVLDELARGAGALLVVEEALSPEALASLADAIAKQPNWSDLPILVLTHHGASSPVVRHVLEHLGNIQLMERPVRVATMVSMVRGALRSRERQYRMRAAQASLKESEERFRVVATMAPFPLMIHAEDGEILNVNRAWTELTGYAPADIPTMEQWLDFAFEEKAASTRMQIEGIYDISEPTHSHEFAIRCKNGERRTWDFSSAPLGKLSDGRRAIISMAADVTERKRAAEELKLAAMVYQESSEAMLMMDEGNRIVSVNAAFERITGYREKEIIRRKPGFLSSRRDNRRHYRDMLLRLGRQRYWKGELWLKNKDGKDFAAALTINTTFDPAGGVNRHVVLFSDITEKKGADELIWKQANFDSLTGLPNRSMFQSQLKQEIGKAKRNGQPMALLLLDLDGFKYVNDTMGHDIGDKLLRDVAARLRKCVRDIDVVARLGGDEFTVILADLHGADNAETVAQSILHVLSQRFELGAELVHISASIGITLYPQDALTMEDLIKNADQAMYAAKQGGRNGYRYFTYSMQEAAHVRMRTINELRDAMAHNQLVVRYQPIVDLANGDIVKAEALIRWQHPTRGLVKPVEFIATAEDSGLITDFGDWVFRRAAEQAARWRKRYRSNFQISVNISPVQFKAGGTSVSAWLGHLRDLELPGSGIVVEITEGVLLDASTHAEDKLAAFQAAGIEVALDDFGTGFSALSYLKKFDIDFIKVDRTFVENLTRDSDDLALCEAIIAMAHKLSIRVIAEGIETREQCALLAAAGCDYGQGFLFSRPVSAEQFEDALKEQAHWREAASRAGKPQMLDTLASDRGRRV